MSKLGALEQVYKPVIQSLNRKPSVSFPARFLALHDAATQSKEAVRSSCKVYLGVSEQIVLAHTSNL